MREAVLITPLRSQGGHRRYSRYQLRIAARARELAGQGFPIEAACRIVIFEDPAASRLPPSPAAPGTKLGCACTAAGAGTVMVPCAAHLSASGASCPIAPVRYRV